MYRFLIFFPALLAFVTMLPFMASANNADAFALEVVEISPSHSITATQTLDLDQLRALPSAEIRTTTIWTEGVQTFRGVWLSTLMDHLGITEGELVFSALNEYLVEIEMKDIVPGGPLVAYEWNGNPMSPRDKGPLWIVFPYDSDVKFQSETVYAQSIWQLDRIEISR